MDRMTSRAATSLPTPAVCTNAGLPAHVIFGTSMAIPGRTGR